MRGTNTHIAHIVFLRARWGSSAAYTGSGAKKHGVGTTRLPRRPRNVRCRVTCVGPGVACVAYGNAREDAVSVHLSGVSLLA